MEVFDEIDIGKSVRAGRLVLSGQWGADYAAALAWGAVEWQYRLTDEWTIVP